jgi:hypothetical protein
MSEYSDINKPSADLLEDDFSSKNILKIKTKAGCVGVTSETERVKSAEDKVNLTSKISLKWKSPSGYFSIDKLSHSPEGSLGLETSLSNLAPNLKFIFKGSNKVTGRAGFEYSYNNFKTTTTHDIVDFVDVSNSSSLNLGNSALVGGSCTYNYKDGWKQLSFGGNYTHNNLFVSAFSSSEAKKDKESKFTPFKDVTLNTRYNVSKDLSVGTQTTHTKEKPLADSFAVGFALDTAKLPGINKATIRSKVNDKWKLNSAISFNPAKGVNFTGNSELSLKDNKGVKFSAGVTIG